MTGLRPWFQRSQIKASVVYKKKVIELADLSSFISHISEVVRQNLLSCLPRQHVKA